MANEENPPPVLPPIDPTIVQYFDIRIEQFRKEFFDELMATVMDNIKPLQDSLANPRSSGTSGSALRPNPPPMFDGSREHARGFLETCILYVQLRPGDFPDDATKLRWMLTFLTSGRALTWRNGILHTFGEEGSFRWANLPEFVADFKKEFYPISEEEDALVALEGSGYFQKPSESVDAYVDRIQDLLERAELQDGRTKVVKFRRGLLTRISKALSESPQPPDAGKIDQWITRARNYERSQQLQENLSGTRQSHPPARPNLFAALRTR